MSSRQTFTSVSDYLAALSPSQAKALRSVLATVRKSVPSATPVISYGIPALKQDRVFIYCAAFKKHIGVYPPIRDDAKLRVTLKPYANAKGNLSFHLDKAMPLPLIARVAKALAKQYARGSTARPTRKVRAKSTKVAPSVQ
jgi:uncharacterized protein YdhG (YjbR/CyaY superfamily)